ncbi:YokU family protein [Neobacillus sp. MM2021_6]|uniref:YokU family protein n=1 Tax=Bacillaceae TaxID=186817 RepID=UPI001408BB1A|nr:MULTISPECIES: YokU family protein [Bacillaceae]MBO0958306.1 YokU family protein [Neobacillus sp. MM2021_6]NHC17906.1 YokU family protein [Bacillus sp. MM2020_4]WML40228.1 YokU family protein [Neobacillus sp. OS1-2]
MKIECEWCNSTGVEQTTNSVFWELPDGSRAIEIAETPTYHCSDCDMIYQSEVIVKEIENHLYLIDCKQIGKVITFEELMKIRRLLKKNYFDFSN